MDKILNKILNKISNKIVATILASTLIISLSIGSLSLIKSTKIVREKSDNIMMNALKSETKDFEGLIESATYNANSIEKFINNSIDLSKVNEEYIKTYTNSLKPIIKGLTENDSSIHNVFIIFNPKLFEKSYPFAFTNRGKSVVELDVSKRYTMSEQDERNKWFFDCLKNKKDLWYTPYEDDQTKETVISYIKPIFKDDKPLGIVCIDLFFKDLKGNISNATPMAKGSYGVLDDKFNFIVHKTFKEKDNFAKLIGKSPEEFNEVIKENKEGKLDYKYQGEKQKSRYSLLSNGWVIVGMEKEKDVFADVISLRHMIISLIILGALITCAIALYFGRNISRSIVKAKGLVDKTAKLELEVDESYLFLQKNKDETGDIARSIIDLRSELRGIVGNIGNRSEETTQLSVDLSSSSSQLVKSMESVAITTNELAKGVQEQAKEVEKSNERLLLFNNEISKMIESSNEAKDKIDVTKESSSKGMLNIDELLLKIDNNFNATSEISGNIEELSKKSENIVMILDTIQSIAEQTNLLALNAAIEAARAGEKGKGFAVVADEIRKLSEETSSATKEVEKLLDDIKGEVNRAKNNMKVAQDTSNEAKNSVDVTKNAFIDIDNNIIITLKNISELLRSIKEIDDDRTKVIGSLQNISAISEQSSAATEEVSASMEEELSEIKKVADASEKLNNLVEKLENIIKKFKF